MLKYRRHLYPIIIWHTRDWPHLSLSSALMHAVIRRSVYVCLVIQEFIQSPRDKSFFYGGDDLYTRQLSLSLSDIHTLTRTCILLYAISNVLVPLSSYFGLLFLKQRWVFDYSIFNRMVISYSENLVGERNICIWEYFMIGVTREV